MTNAPRLDKALAERLKDIRLLALDVDGVLTDGRLYFAASGDELKAFNILDGLGLKLVRQAGVEVALITGRDSPLTRRRAEDLKIRHLVQGREDKLVALKELLGTLQIGLGEVAYVGDDLPDLSAIRAVRAGISVSNGHWRVKQDAVYITQQSGGHGAVREVCDLICEAKGALTGFHDHYSGSAKS